jgi:predicted RNA binding protein with dsRBD fold (UPF0201 family)
MGKLHILKKSMGEELDKRNICITVQQEAEEKEIQELSDYFTEEQIINALRKLINKNGRTRIPV